MKSLLIITSLIALVACAVVAMQLHSSKSTGQVMATTAGSGQLWTCGMHPQVLQDHPGNCPICHMKLVPVKMDEPSNTSGGSKKIAYWWDPMLGPGSMTNHPGKSAMGMDLVPVYEDQASNGPSVRIDPAVVQNMGVVTAAVVRGPVTVTVRAVGTLQVPEPGMHDVALKVNGFVEKLYADTQGMAVQKGQVLFDLYSPDIQVTAAELIDAQKRLGESGANHQAAQERLDFARQRLRLWDVAEQDIDAIAASASIPPTVPIRSPVDGHIVDKMVVGGSAVTAGMKLMRIENHSQLWLDTQVYEDQIQAVKIGQEVRASVDGVAGKTFVGKVSFIYPHFDHMARTEIVRAVLDNPEHELRPGMYATAQIITQPVQDAVLVLRQAIIDTGTQQLVFVADPMSAGHFESRKIKVGISGDDDQVQVIEGLTAGELVVTSGQFLMDVESRTSEAIQKLRGSTTQP